MDSHLIKRTDMDFLSRSFPGLFVYAAAWPVLAWGSGFFDDEYLTSLVFSSLFIGISALRVTHAYATPYVYSGHPKIWRFVLFTLALCHAATLSAVQVYLILENQHYNMTLLTAMVLVGLLSGAASSLAPKVVFTQIYIALIMLPTIIACLYVKDFIFLAPLFVVMWLYYFFMCKRYHNEYARAFHIEMKLKENQLKLEKLNQTDTLTGIYNRQYFDNALDLQWDLASRSQTSISILFLDLDFFKKINDTYGHIIGDRALCHAAKILKETAKRRTDMVARYGGEEFAIILACTQHDIAKELAEQIRHKIETTPLQYGELTIHITASLGVSCTIPSNQKSCISFLDEADQALYQAKHTGRNKVVSFLDKKD